MDYNFNEIENKWRKRWAENNIYRTSAIGSKKPKYYALDMFPYPSGSGLHVGHPLGYIASDIIARFKRLKGFNVLHPMGWDAFGLPAEQYAIQTGQHPAVTTEANIKRYREQLDMLGLSYDWSREVKTSDPKFYKWTQWIFLKLFKSWYNVETDKAEPIDGLIHLFEKSGTQDVHAFVHNHNAFSADEWKSFSEKEKSDILFNYRLAYLSEAWVNWCPQLGTVLANDEVKDGVSERGGYPVERKLMPQWSLRITAYAERLLNDLNTIDWTENIKEAQRNWIGRSEGTSLKFDLAGLIAYSSSLIANIEVFTTRPDTVFGVSFITLAPENELVSKITTPEHLQQVEDYVKSVKSKSERERQAEVKNVSGVFTGAYAIHPFTGKKIPVWIGDYVLAGYGTGAVMGVPAHDSRDHAFATHFKLNIPQVITAPDNWNFANESFDAKEGACINSDFLNGMWVKDAIKRAIAEIEKRGIGKSKVNYRLRDAAFGRQRYWGEPIPIYYKTAPRRGDTNSHRDDGELIPTALEESELLLNDGLQLPPIDNFKPTETGEPPLARAKNWKYKGQYEYEHTTMPGWAGSSWYYLRYMDPHNENEFCSQEAINYWQNVDLYVGGAEHVTGHLLYVRFWTKFLYDLGLVPFTEPAKKLVNQGMILGESKKIYRGKFLSNTVPLFDLSSGGSLPIPISNDEPVPIFISSDVFDKMFANNTYYKNNPEVSIPYSGINIPIDLVNDMGLDIPRYLKTRNITPKSVFILSNADIWQNGRILRKSINGYEIGNGPIIFKTFSAPEKMSKSKLNVVNPDDVVKQYGADTLRMYEMFLGPLELSKPWSTQGISGVHGFLKKLWRMVVGVELSNDQPTAAELKILHKTIKKVNEDMERLSFNTSVSAFMICLNELFDLKCNKKAIYEPLLVCLSPFAPFIAEELWSRLGHNSSIMNEKFPEFDESFLQENTFTYPVSFNGKTRFTLELPRTLTKEQIEKEVLESENVKKWLQEKPIKKIIVVPNKIVNVVI